MKTNYISVLLSLLLSGCAITKDGVTEKQTNKTKILVQAGITHGGIVENTDMKKIPGTEVDAFSGATKAGINAGVHAKIPIGSNAAETGIDYMLYNQEFTYNDGVNNYNGSKQIFTSQVAVPLTFNFSLLKRNHADKEFQFKIGYLANINFLSYSNEKGTLPEYSDTPFAHGFTLGLSTTPVLFENGNKLGLFLDMYRGSQIYEDFYNQESFEMPGSSFFKIGVAYQFQ